MNFQVVVCSHEQSNLELREKIAFPNEETLNKAYDVLAALFPKAEHVILSTCNRVEIYTAQEDDVDLPTREEVLHFLADFHHLPLDDQIKLIPAMVDQEAVTHLFRVVSGLDSMVLGEPQIVNQVKQAYKAAHEKSACGPLTHAWFQDAIHVSARVRSETALAEGKVSIASVAVGEFGKNIFETFTDKVVLVIGAGEMADEALTYLTEEGVRQLVIVNRNFTRGEALAEKFGGTPRPYEQLEEWLASADIIISATGADRPIVTKEMFAATRKQNQQKNVFILDLGAPRDFEPAISDLDENVFLFDIDDLEQTCQRNRGLRHKEINKGEQIIEEQTQKFMQALYHRATGPVVKRLMEQWSEVRDQELDRLFSRLDSLNETEQQEITYAIDRVLKKLLHPPLQTLKDQAREGTPHSLMDALRRLFRLSD
ncbi:Glutamyl-tRNA reductase [Polystyrenella longa]|uniref:Glutamyl-tRNA reductase n=1 Tax=Polystyrenella longa TaxID=2528007 RepID=A0A518CNW0_9PLAN|nr:glutamyl-tRNA reductase [Polystyrenella longa]QDU80903.1 Glutamyl-tRNA reductase [Polystyrenella longa]